MYLIPHGLSRDYSSAIGLIDSAVRSCDYGVFLKVIILADMVMDSGDCFRGGGKGWVE